MTSSPKKSFVTDFKASQDISVNLKPFKLCLIPIQDQDLEESITLNETTPMILKSSTERTILQPEQNIKSGENLAQAANKNIQESQSPALMINFERIASPAHLRSEIGKFKKMRFLNEF